MKYRKQQPNKHQVSSEEEVIISSELELRTSFDSLSSISSEPLDDLSSESCEGNTSRFSDDGDLSSFWSNFPDDFSDGDEDVKFCLDFEAQSFSSSSVNANNVNASFFNFNSFKMMSDDEKKRHQILDYDA